MLKPQYFLGCPMWANKHWVGKVFSSDTKPKDYLKSYGSVFNTVEGNTTFYALPKISTIEKWAQDAPPGFRFCFKFPRTISHDKALQGTDGDVAHFFETLAPLEKRIGPYFLQLAPSFKDLNALERFLVKLPREYRFAVEVRNIAFFQELEQDFEEILRELEMDRVVFDTRPLQALKTDEHEIREAQRKKPKMPPRFEATFKYPFLRYAGNPDVLRDTENLQAWVEVVARWIREGRTPYVFMHQAPDDTEAPLLGRMFHLRLQELVPSLPDLPHWPAETEPRQLELF